MKKLFFTIATTLILSSQAEEIPQLASLDAPRVEMDTRPFEKPEVNHEEEQTVERCGGRMVYSSTYPWTAHYVSGVTVFNESLILEDGSVWYISPSYRSNINPSWYTTDPAIIVPYNSWFSSYGYEIINLNTLASVPVKLEQGPFYDGAYTRWIIAIDPYTHEVWLNDGSYWILSGLDESIFYQWMVHDTVIVGINNDSFAATYPNILINVNLHKFHPYKKYVNYVRAAFVQ